MSRSGSRGKHGSSGTARRGGRHSPLGPAARARPPPRRAPPAVAPRDRRALRDLGAHGLPRPGGSRPPEHPPLPGRERLPPGRGGDASPVGLDGRGARDPPARPRQSRPPQPAAPRPAPRHPAGQARRGHPRRDRDPGGARARRAGAIGPGPRRSDRPPGVRRGEPAPGRDPLHLALGAQPPVARPRSLHPVPPGRGLVRRGRLPRQPGAPDLPPGPDRRGAPRRRHVQPAARLRPRELSRLRLVRLPGPGAPRGGAPLPGRAGCPRRARPPPRR